MTDKMILDFIEKLEKDLKKILTIRLPKLSDSSFKAKIEDIIGEVVVLKCKRIKELRSCLEGEKKKELFEVEK